jgi:hypothetical protein
VRKGPAIDVVAAVATVVVVAGALAFTAPTDLPMFERDGKETSRYEDPGRT